MRELSLFTGLSTTTVMKIAKGETKRVLARTADLVLGITTDQRARKHALKRRADG